MAVRDRVASKPHFDTTLIDRCYALGRHWEEASNSTNFSKEDTEGWSSDQLVVFLDSLKPLHDTFIMDIDRLYGFSRSKNCEVLFRFYSRALESNCEDMYPSAARWMSSVGRMKYVCPMYQLLNKVNPSLAASTFESARSMYHPICEAQVAKILASNPQNP